jgi:(p)ppGpp synthase/HD superfamily hydrolase
MVSETLPMTDWTEIIRKCDEIAETHKGQFRRDGVTPYITHPRAVAAMFTEHEQLQKCIALLHDVLEDTDMTDAQLLELGVPKQVVDGVLVLTRQKDEPYFDYIDRIVASDLTGEYCHLKMSDITHNLFCGTNKPGEAKRYFQAFRTLSKWRYL